MSFVLQTSTLVGIDAVPVQVEVDILNRLPSVVLVGLPNGAAKETADRVRAAIQSASFEWPRRRVVINLAPADLRKVGHTGLDLPIAIGVLAATEQVPDGRIAKTVFLGELSLSGELRPIRGALSHAMAALASGATTLVVPSENAQEAAMVAGLQVYGLRTLRDVCDWLEGYEYTVEPHTEPARSPSLDALDMADCRLTPETRDVLLVAALGGPACSLLMVGPQGGGATMLATRLAGLRPPMTTTEALEVVRIHSVAGLTHGQRRAGDRPFRAPHHTISSAGMIGNVIGQPGEVTLAHNGVLLLDEPAELARFVQDGLHAVLAAGGTRVGSATGALATGARLPAGAQLVVSTHACVCAHGLTGRGACICSAEVRDRYQARVRAPDGAFTLLLRLARFEPGAADAGAAVYTTAELQRRVMRAADRLRGMPFPAVLTEASCDWLRMIAVADDRAALLWVGRVRRVATWARALDIGVVTEETAELDTLRWAALHVPRAGFEPRSEGEMVLAEETWTAPGWVEDRVGADRDAG